jgi:hypothetical protein
MSQKKFSSTRLVLVVVLLGGLFAISKAVTPPPPAPPAGPEKAPPVNKEPHKGEDGPSPKMSAKDIADRMKMEEMMNKRNELKKKLTLEANGGKPLTPDDGISSEYFKDHAMGAQGIKQSDADVENAKRVNAIVDAKLQKLMPMPTRSAPGKATPMQAPPPPNDPPAGN